MSTRIVIAPDANYLQPIAGQIDAIFATQQGTLLHHGRNVIRQITVDGHTVVVKHYKRPNVVQRLAYTFLSPSKCRRAYEYAKLFRQRGIDTPRELGYIERYACGLFADGYFFSEACLWQNAKMALPDQGPYDRNLARDVARLVTTLHSKGILHGDLNLSNILYQSDGDGYRFTLIDTNRSRFLDGEPSHDECLRNLMRITHRRDLFELIIRQYALLRGWEGDKTVQASLKLLEKFEKRKHIMGIIKKRLKKK